LFSRTRRGIPKFVIASCLPERFASVADTVIAINQTLMYIDAPYNRMMTALKAT